MQAHACTQAPRGSPRQRHAAARSGSGSSRAAHALAKLTHAFVCPVSTYTTSAPRAGRKIMRRPETGLQSRRRFAQSRRSIGRLVSSSIARPGRPRMPQRFALRRPAGRTCHYAAPACRVRTVADKARGDKARFKHPQGKARVESIGAGQPAEEQQILPPVRAQRRESHSHLRPCLFAPISAKFTI